MSNLQELRKKIRQERAKLTSSFIEKAACKVADAIADTNVFMDSNHIAFYYPVAGELDPTVLMRNAWNLNKNCYLPVLNNDQTLSFIMHNDGDPLIANGCGILEPAIDKEKAIAPQDLDLVIVPLVGFDIDGNRLGMGFGYYDRTFSFMKKQMQKKPYLMGVGYEFQNLSRINSQPWDIPLNAVATEVQLRICHPAVKPRDPAICLIVTKQNRKD